MKPFENVDVIVVGTGNAASCAALAAREKGARVIMLDAATQDARGGNSAYAGGRMRVVYNGVDDLAKIIPLSDEDVRNIDFGRYRREDFFDDMARVTQYRCHPDLVEHAINSSFDALVWLRDKGVRFQPGRQAARVKGKLTHWGGLPCEVWSGGAGLVEMLHARAEKDGIAMFYETPAMELRRDDRRITGVRAFHQGHMVEIRARAVVLACGGIEANAEMRTRYLGPNWDLAKVRGTRYNTGRGLTMALAAGARAYGHWSCAHASAWDLNAPEYGDSVVRGAYQKHSYPIGIMVNARGERFLDEGADYPSYTYARYGREILAQPGMFAWQIFDQRAMPELRDTYRIRQVTKVTAATLEELAGKLEGVDGEGFLRTLAAFNNAVPDDDAPYNTAVRDGLATRGLSIPKSNWARRIDRGPFEAYAVTTGITFTFGGIKISTQAEAEDDGGNPLPGLFVAGEMVGGLFYHNYPSGTGLTCGAVYGRTAGHSAAAFAQTVGMPA